MSANNIEAVLKWVGQGDAPPELDDALKELSAIREMARSIVSGGGTDALRANYYDVSVDLLERIAKEEAP